MRSYRYVNGKFARKSFNSGNSAEKAYGGERNSKGLVVDCQRDVFNIQRACVLRVDRGRSRVCAQRGCRANYLRWKQLISSVFILQAIGGKSQRKNRRPAVRRLGRCHILHHRHRLRRNITTGITGPRSWTLHPDPGNNR